MPTKGATRGKKKLEPVVEEGGATAAEPAPAAAPEPAAAAAPEPAAAAAPEPAAAAAPEPIPSASTPKKRTSTSKKPVKVIAVVTPDGIEGSFAPEPRRPLIAHLQIRSSELLFHGENGANPSQDAGNGNPTAYDPADANPFQACQERLRGTVEGDHVQAFAGEAATESVDACVPVPTAAPTTVSITTAAKSMPCFTRSDLMVQFKDASEQKCLPASTEIACFWCAHTFEGMPCVIPEREVNGIYTVYANFCCPECATSYLLSESLDPHVRWERLSLLQRIYDVGGNGRIFPAPCRESLKMFGGPMSIEVFRATIREKKVRVDLHMPPMVSILGSIDTKPIDFFDTTLKHGGPITAATPAAAQRAGEEGLRLKRTKPLKDKESTLDTLIHIKINSSRGLVSA